MSLVDFSAKSVTCEIELVGGHKVELTFRPFTLADLAWLETSFNEEEALQIAAMKVKPLSKIIWNQLTSECKAEFSDVIFEEYNEETEKVETIKIMGYEKLLHSIQDQKSLIEAFKAYSKVADLNSFLPDEKKKKTVTKAK